ncbi:hypothetical protein MRX96_023442 [Rhipicephalus microplus]
MQRPTRAHSADLALHFGHRESGRAQQSAMLITSNCEERQSNNASDVQPSSRRLRQYTTYHVPSRSSLCLLVYYLSQNLQHYLSILSDRQVYTDTASMYRAINGCLVLEEHSMWHEFRHIFLDLGAPNGWLPAELQPGARPCVHLPRDLISVLSSAMAAQRTLYHHYQFFIRVAA